MPWGVTAFAPTVSTGKSPLSFLPSSASRDTLVKVFSNPASRAGWSLLRLVSSSWYDFFNSSVSFLPEGAIFDSSIFSTSVILASSERTGAGAWTVANNSLSILSCTFSLIAVSPFSLKSLPVLKLIKDFTLEISLCRSANNNILWRIASLTFLS